jgi:hypothetical protein
VHVRVHERVRAVHRAYPRRIASAGTRGDEETKKACRKSLPDVAGVAVFAAAFTILRAAESPIDPAIYDMTAFSPILSILSDPSARHVAGASTARIFRARCTPRDLIAI